ncbi:unnamed protein product [Darwinula stevensoni]|uniref:Chloride channel protein n=1 Tax=Darwinula stevensoni TaxID=69355 RepID=A0A7R9A8B2_9CRUS|nr:unnamed protein product [Darwinula stevensoni]CAG0896249.1 unnamed protein product [Darwinula stevensoni]
MTVMYGRYTRDLGEYVKEEAKRLKQLEKARKREEKLRTKELRKYRGKWATRSLNVLSFVWRNTFARLGEDWVFLALLGILMALISFAMDFGIAICNLARIRLFRDLATHPGLQFLAWVAFPVFLILFSAGFTHIVEPQAIGSGIPEMKTILRGVQLKEYLTFRMLIAKVVGLTACLGSGMPLGKEGPFVHIASVMATLLGKLVTTFKGIYENESHNIEMLAAACAVGVACTFSAPIGGVLFSIEVTAVYFAVRNYWRGFFAAVNGALIFRLLAVWLKSEETLTALFVTNYTIDFPFDAQELVVFGLIGVVSGFGGALWVWMHRRYVIFMRRNKKIKWFLQKNRFIYPGVVALLISGISCPLALGQFMASDLTTHEQVEHLFSNFSWASVADAPPGTPVNVEQAEKIHHWATPHSNIFLTLTVYFLSTAFLSILASTLPVPSGIFIPVFKIGAAFGRLVGEAMAIWFPRGVRTGNVFTPIQPGGYAVVGAAAFSGAVTHTISVSVIVFELTGQITHMLPVMIAVLISNAIAQLLQPSIYDSIIQIKKLPFLPDIISSKSAAYHVMVEDFMILKNKLKYVWHGMRYRDLREVLKDSRKLRTLPVVDSHESMHLLGSIRRRELVTLLEMHLGKERRMQVTAKWHSLAKRALSQERERLMAEGIQRSLTPPPPSITITSENPEKAEGCMEDVETSTEARRLSRFEVVPANERVLPPVRPTLDGISLINELTKSSKDGDEPYHPTRSLPAPGMRPKKGILKKTPSFHFSDENSDGVGLPSSTHSTVTSTDSRWRRAFEAIVQKAHALHDGEKSPGGTLLLKHVTLPRERVIDLPLEEQKQWEEAELDREVNFEAVPVDPAPFQLVEGTTLLKVHSLFSLLGLKQSYVTSFGRLIGVVSLVDLRKAIEDVNSGSFHANACDDDAGLSDGDVESGRSRAATPTGGVPSEEEAPLASADTTSVSSNEEKGKAESEPERVSNENAEADREDTLSERKDK